MVDFFDLLLADAIASGLARQAAAERARQERPPPENFFILPADPQAWRQVHASCKRENMVIGVEVTDDTHAGSRSVQPLFVDLAREVSNIPFFRIKIGFGRAFTQLREDLGGITHTPTVIVVFYDDDGMRIRSAQGVEEVRLAMRSGWFKSRIADFLEQRAKLKLAEKLAEELAGQFIRNEMEEKRKRARLEYEQKLRREREAEELRARLEQQERQEQEEKERRDKERQREAIEIKKRELEEERRRNRPKVLDELMKMDLDTARMKDIKDIMSKLGLSYVGLCERKEFLDKLKANVPELRMKTSQTQPPHSSYSQPRAAPVPAPRTTSTSNTTATQWQRRAEMAESNVEELENRRQKLEAEVTSLQRQLREKDSTIKQLQNTRQSPGSGGGFFSRRGGGGGDTDALHKRVKQLEDELLETKMLYTTTLDDFELESRFSKSENSEGVVVRVRCTRSDLPVPNKIYVMKVLHNVHQKQTTTMVRAEFKNEFDILCRLPQHNNIIHQFAFFYDKPMKYPNFSILHGEGMALFILLEELQQNMSEYLKTICSFGSPKAIQVIQWMKCLLSGLDFLFSRNVVHRDLKLQNLLMSDDGLKICDFGLAIELDSTMEIPYTQGLVTGGNPAHLAPEILNARPGPRKRISYLKQPVWAAGVLAYELSGHHSPFGSIDQQAYSTSSLPLLKKTEGASGSQDTIPSGLTTLVQSMLDFKPENRPTLANALKQVSSLL